ncbi:two-component sensor histidine kinase [Brevibacillus humidisoli]|uniref:sensor histidine kinase n=1 Tax=Brevibacillus humidisoli TaxID=2895522 RepID=UPI001E358D19|nr:HAMP domain-containing sensor histidine kinase [Brevibacillus humidisoli]UFJ39874.1 two-component sensor histidine kinase [Brevibacillus humidisoli]
MKVRTYLVIANGSSILFILLCLLVSYIKMFLSLEATIWLGSITVIAGILSFLLHFFLTRPLENALLRITEESKRLAEGSFQTAVPEIGPCEFQMLASQFNEMSRRLEQSFTQLQASEASRRELVANVSHDLRTPLASIQTFVEALQDDVIKDEETFQRYLKTIKLETKRLSSLIDDLFHLSRLESGTEEFSPQPYHADSLILETLQGLTIQLEEKQVQLSVEMPERLPPVLVMPEKIKRAIANLLENAIRHSPIGGVITLSVEESEESFVKVSVADNGDGLPEAERDRIFERFYRTDKSRSREKGGSGLGLAIVKAIVAEHQGQLGVDSAVGHGSRFWFTIPKTSLSSLPAGHRGYKDETDS